MRRYRALIICLLLGFCVVGLVLNRIWVGFGWDMVYRGDMTYGARLAAEYATYRAAHGAWPKPDELSTRLHFQGTSSISTNRVDRYDCGRYAAYTLEVWLSPNGEIEFYCWEKK
jgi:hypothetical protein